MTTYHLFHVDSSGSVWYRSEHDTRSSAWSEYERDYRNLESDNLQPQVTEVCVYKGDDMIWSTEMPTYVGDIEETT